MTRPPQGGFFMPVTRFGWRHATQWRITSVAGRGCVHHFFRVEQRT